MLNIFILFLVLSSTSSLAESAQSNHELNKWFDEFQLKASLNSNIVEAENLKARVFGFRLNATLKDKITTDTSFFLDAVLILESGSNEAIASIAEYQPIEGVNFNEGGFAYQPWPFLKLRLGALNQKVLNSPLLVGPNAFVAFEQSLLFNQFYLRTQQAIPNNNMLTKRIGSVDTGTPQFITETFGLNFGEKNFFNAEFSHFKYRDLSSDVANKSITIGNSTSGINSSTRYLYEFEGLNTAISSRFYLGSVGLLLGGEYLYNDKAPSKRNSGTLAMLGLELCNHVFKVESFRNESDTAPAFYNYKYYGHNNMQGTAAIYEYDDKDINLKLRYAQFSPVEENNLQVKTELFSFNLSKTY